MFSEFSHGLEFRIRKSYIFGIISKELHATSKTINVIKTLNETVAFLLEKGATVLDQLERPTPNPNPPKWYKGSIRENSEFSQKMKYFSSFPVYWKLSKKNKKFKNLFNIDNSRESTDKIIFKALILSGEHFLADRIFKNSLFRMVYIGY